MEGQSARISAVVIGALVCTMLLVGSSSAQFSPAEKNVIVTDQKAEVKGVILTRDGEMLVIRDIQRKDTTVVLTDTTKVRTERKFLFGGHKPYDVTVLVPGLIVTVEGKGCEQGRLLAKDITFTEPDFRAAVAAYVQAAPIKKEAAQNKQQIAQTEQQLAATSTQLATTTTQLAATDRSLEDTSKEVVATNQRISNLDKYDVAKVVTVYFKTDSVKLTKEAKAQLDELASKAPEARNYMVEVKGYADPRGNLNKNLELSQRRADAVVEYLTVQWNIPLRRISVPMGYGDTVQVGDAKTKAGRAQDRRVEVSVLFNKGLTTSE